MTPRRAVCVRDQRVHGDSALTESKQARFEYPSALLSGLTLGIRTSTATDVWASRRGRTTTTTTPTTTTTATATGTTTFLGLLLLLSSQPAPF